MKESKFIDQNKEKWESLERMIRAENSDPRVLCDLFIQLTDDLSYSRTFYHNRTVRAYLNNLARKIFEKIYVNKRFSPKKILEFWTEELPSIIYQSRFELTTSFLIFIFSVAIGVFSSLVDSDFAKMILGEQYIEMTIENIESGDPMAVYKKMNQVDMFLGITWNNILVAFRTFIFGIFLSLGTILILIYNGIMVGAFQFFFIEQSMFMESFLAIWIHGTFEISSIIIAGGAGIVFGKGILFPGTLTRLQSFQESAVRALKIFIGIVPIFIIAGLLESFVTRYTDVPAYLRLSIILLSASIIVFYFVYLPFKRRRISVPTYEAHGVSQTDKFEKSRIVERIYNVSEILNFTFFIYNRYLKKIARIVLLTSLVYPLLYIFYIQNPVIFVFDTDQDFFYSIKLLFNYESYPILIIPNTLILSLILVKISTYISKSRDGSIIKNYLFFKLFIKVLIPILIIQSLFFIRIPVLPLVLVLLVLPYLFHWITSIVKTNKNIFLSLNQSIGLVNMASNRLWGYYIATLILVSVGLVFFNSPVFLSSTTVLAWNFPYDPETVSSIVEGIEFWFVAFIIHLLLPFVFIAIFINHYSMEEIHSADGLKKMVDNF